MQVLFVLHDLESEAFKLDSIENVNVMKHLFSALI